MKRKIALVTAFLVMLFGCLPGFSHGATASDFLNNAIPTTFVYPGTGGILIMDITLPQPDDDTLKHDGGTYAVSAGDSLSSFGNERCFDHSTTDNNSYDDGEAIFRDDGDGNLESSTTDPIITAGDADFTQITTNIATTSTDPGYRNILMTTNTGSNQLWEWGEYIFIDVDGDNNWTTTTDIVLVAGTGNLGAIRAAGQVTTTDASWASPNIGFLDANHNGKLDWRAYQQGVATTSEPIIRTATAGQSNDYNITSSDHVLTAAKNLADYRDINGTWSADWTLLSSITNLKYHDGSGNSQYDDGEDIVVDDDASGYYRADKLNSIKVSNGGTVTDLEITQICVWEDGSTAGWNGGADETKKGCLTTSTKWGQAITGNISAFSLYRYPRGTNSQERIFITVDISLDAQPTRYFQAKLVAGSGTSAPVRMVNDSANNGPTNTDIVANVRNVVAPAAPVPSPPVAPTAQTPEAVATDTIRWKFTDNSDVESGFKIIADSEVKVSASVANLSFLDEKGLEPNTQYSGRKVIAFNAGGESPASAEFPAIYTLAPTPSSLVKLEYGKNAITVQVVGGPTNLTEAKTGLFFENITTGTNSGWIQENFWISTDLSPDTEYEFRVKARNGDGVETPWSETVKIKTMAVEVPVVEKPITEMTVEELKAKIKEIMQKIADLKAQLVELQKGMPFQANLRYGDRGDEVKKLQEALIKEGVLAEGLNTGWFGPLTKAAVIKFQEKYADEILTPLGLTAGTGFVGEKTRAKLNALYGK